MDARGERWARRFEAPVLIAALLVIPLLVIDQLEMGGPWNSIELVLDWGTWLVFLLEIVVMLSVVPDRKRWLREHPIDVVATLCSPPILPTGLAAARLLRLLRVLRILRLAPLLRRTFSLDGLRYAGLLAFMTLLGGGTAFAAVEHKQSEWDGIWWATVTMATVGYGDLSPETVAGRVIAIVVMVVGIGFTTLAIGAVAERFLGPRVEVDVEAAESDLRAELRELAARMERIELALRAKD